MFPNVTLILGGASSGKSDFAEKFVVSADRPATYIATAQAGDEEMAARILRHRTARGDSWTTVETPLQVGKAVNEVPKTGIILLDCATMWLSNHMAAGSDIEREQSALFGALDAAVAPVVVVSNEVGQGGVAANTLARRFAEKQGALNIQLAQCADLVVLVTAGIPQAIKGSLAP